MDSDSLALLSLRMARPRTTVEPPQKPDVELTVKLAVSAIRSFGAPSSLLSSRKLPRLLMVKAVAPPRRAAAPLSWKRPPLTRTVPVNVAVLDCPL